MHSIPFRSGFWHSVLIPFAIWLPLAVANSKMAKSNLKANDKEICLKFLTWFHGDKCSDPIRSAPFQSVPFPRCADQLDHNDHDDHDDRYVQHDY